MVEYHGWVSINQSVDGENEENIDEILLKIDKMFSESSIVNEYYKIVRINYSNALHFAGSHNHNDTLQNKILGLFSSVGNMASGSYGLLYFRDDESEEYPNRFYVYCMSRGQVELKEDVYLSPCNPKIEE